MRRACKTIRIIRRKGCRRSRKLSIDYQQPVSIAPNGWMRLYGHEKYPEACKRDGKASYTDLLIPENLYSSTLQLLWQVWIPKLPKSWSNETVIPAKKLVTDKQGEKHSVWCFPQHEP